MKSKLLIIGSIVFCVAFQSVAQNDFKWGVGYYGETMSHPGVVVQAEYSYPLSSKFSVPIRVDGGYYFHKRNHQAVFSDIVTGIRWHISPRFYAGINGGVGLMASWHHSDEGVYEVGDNGNIVKASNFAGIDFLPSTSFEIGYKVNQKTDNYIWLRTKASWQKNVNSKGLMHAALEIGYSFNISRN